MDILYGLAGVVGLGIFAAILGLDARALLGFKDRSVADAWQYDDPNSTLGVTLDVLAEKLDQPRAELMMARG